MATKTKAAKGGNGKAPAEEIAPAGTHLQIRAPNFLIAVVDLLGTSPLLVHRFAKKAEIIRTQEQGSQQAKAKRVKPPRNFEADYEAAKYKDAKAGWEGFHAAAIRNGMIAACRTVGAVMSHAKLAVFIEADGYDEDGIPLVRIHGDPVMDVRPARNSNGSIDLRARPRYDKWHARLRVRYDADMISLEDVANLLTRVGMQVGICELRPSSPKSAGGDYGLFVVKEGPGG